MSRAVLDASAMLAFLRGEPGGDVRERITAATRLASAVNVAEVGSRLSDLGASLAEVRRAIALMAPWRSSPSMPSRHMPRLAYAGRRTVLSLGDRACVQLAASRGLPAVTADRAWAELDVDVEVRLIRD